MTSKKLNLPLTLYTGKTAKFQEDQFYSLEYFDGYKGELIADYQSIKEEEKIDQDGYKYKQCNHYRAYDDGTIARQVVGNPHHYKCPDRMTEKELYG
jgi:hypothetical protein